MPYYHKQEAAIHKLWEALAINVSHQRLKYLDDNGILGTVKRSEGGHRTLTSDQIERAIVAIAYLEIGLSIEDVKCFMDDRELQKLSADEVDHYTIGHLSGYIALIGKIVALSHVLDHVFKKTELLLEELPAFVDQERKQPKESARKSKAYEKGKGIHTTGYEPLTMIEGTVDQLKHYRESVRRMITKDLPKDVPRAK